MGCECSNQNIDHESEIEGNYKDVLKFQPKKKPKKKKGATQAQESPNLSLLHEKNVTEKRRRKNKSAEPIRITPEPLMKAPTEKKNDYFVLSPTPKKNGGNESLRRKKGKKPDTVSFHSIKGMGEQKSAKILGAKELKIEGTTFEIAKKKLKFTISHHRFDQKFKYQGKKKFTSKNFLIFFLKSNWPSIRKRKPGLHLPKRAWLSTVHNK